MQDRIQHHFMESIENLQLGHEQSAPQIERAVISLVNALLNGNKVLSCGNGSCSANAQIFSSIMLHRFARERPGLPAISISGDIATLTAIANDYSYSEVFSKQIRAIGNPGDILLALSLNGKCPNIVQAIQSAHDRDMTVITLTGNFGGEITNLLSSEDIEIPLSGQTNVRILEIQLLIIHCLGEMIDTQLFG